MHRKNAGRIQTKNEQYFGELGLYFFQVFFLILYIFPNNHQQACIILTINQFNISKNKDSSHQKAYLKAYKKIKTTWIVLRRATSEPGHTSWSLCGYEIWDKHLRKMTFFSCLFPVCFLPTQNSLVESNALKLCLKKKLLFKICKFSSFQGLKGNVLLSPSKWGEDSTIRQCIYVYVIYIYIHAHTRIYTYI